MNRTHPSTQRVSYSRWGGSLIHSYTHVGTVASPDTRVQVVDGEFVIGRTAVTKHTPINPGDLLTLTAGGVHRDITIEDLHSARNQ